MGLLPGGRALSWEPCVQLCLAQAVDVLEAFAQGVLQSRVYLSSPGLTGV